jgi:hypothetical protein
MPKKNFFSIFNDPTIRDRILLVLGVLSVLVIAILLSGPKPVEYSDEIDQGAGAATEISASITSTPTAKVDKSTTEYPVTTGVLVGAAAVLAIITFGTILELRQKD